ncbi:hypothetical protein KBX71_08635 [Micromonospora sp. D93]|uniref:hypothetical protein n=1 Tax=Micromonospora sp. D93 TaxID=2824886 RepID=UPI001B3758C1|nr:hypothetical protein [Micromonospora sp. D93]MBQ1017930.1 hypothetical protein [Micromonospora sp. D93]
MTGVPLPEVVRRRSLGEWAASEGFLARCTRLATIAGLSWGVIQFADRFSVKVLPTSSTGVVIFVMGIAIAFLLAELLVVLRSRPSPLSEARSPEEVFAVALLQYARTLASSGNRRDQAILELRRWSSRLLHLMRASKERSELGQIALTAAAAIKDKETQASILIDDLGWALHESGDTQTALANINEALSIIDDKIAASGTSDTLIDLKIKALRHTANMCASSSKLDDARRAFDEPRRLAQLLPVPDHDLQNAQLDHSEAYVILGHLEARVGTTGQIDPSGALGILLAEAVALAEGAEESFATLVDSEREAKALSLKVRLLSHDTRKQGYREASTRLERLMTEVARDLR